MKNLLLLGLALILVSGCSPKNNLYFGTGTSIGLDIVGTPASPISASLAYKRSEVSVSEQNPAKAPYPILGMLDMEVDFWDGTKVDQHFATGKASIIAAYTSLLGSDNQSEVETARNQIANLLEESPPASSPNNNKDETFLFVTGSTIGIDIEAAPEGNPHAVVGYKRVENAFIPVDKENGDVGDVYSRMQFDSQSDQNSLWFTNTGIKQSFATGMAARILARRSELGTEAVNPIAPDNPSNPTPRNPGIN